MIAREAEHSIWSRLRDGRRSGTAQTEHPVRHTKNGRIRGMVVGEGGRSTGVLLYLVYYVLQVMNTKHCVHSKVMFMLMTFLFKV